jgi:hexokinase
MKVKAKYKMIKLICIILMNANHTGNILVYCLTGTEFRTQLYNVLGKNKNFQEQNSIRQGQETSLQTSIRQKYYSTISRSRLTQVKKQNQVR